MSKVKAIRQFCLDCVDQESKQIRNCTATADKCKVWPRRKGTGWDGSRGDVRLAASKMIRQECLLCMGDNVQSVKACTSPLCALWLFRLGHGRCTDPTGETVIKCKTLSPEHIAKLQAGRAR